MSRVFHPWVGDCYAKGIKNAKILILGESHHGGSGCHYAGFTIETIRKEALGLDGHRRRAYFTKIMRLVMGIQYPSNHVSRSAFWDSIAFCNFVQVALDRPRQRPSEADWMTGIVPFQITVDELMPDYIVILGFDLHKWVPTNLPCPSRATMHPSAPGFSYGAWPDLVQDDIQKIKS